LEATRMADSVIKEWGVTGKKGSSAAFKKLRTLRSFALRPLSEDAA